MFELRRKMQLQSLYVGISIVESTLYCTGQVKCFYQCEPRICHLSLLMFSTELGLLLSGQLCVAKLRFYFPAMKAQLSPCQVVMMIAFLRPFLQGGLSTHWQIGQCLSCVSDLICKQPLLFIKIMPLVLQRSCSTCRSVLVAGVFMLWCWNFATPVHFARFAHSSLSVVQILLYVQYVSAFFYLVIER